MEKLDGNTQNIVKMNINRLKELFPNIVNDGKIDFEKLKILLGEEIDTTNEKYSFNWHGKSNTIKFAMQPSTATLIPVQKNSINWDITQNLYIEGDNVEVLKLLQKTYYGKVKMIYIDPPYNTGHDFVYKDNFKDNLTNYKEVTNQTSHANPNTSGRFHTDWLNMMYSRLLLASNLLSNDGVIFISIDDNELSNLKAICDEIFGESNFISIFTWIKTTNPPSLGSKVRDNMEYILCYEKDFNSGNKLYGRESNQKDSPLANATNRTNTVTIPAGKCYFPNFKSGIVKSGVKDSEVVLEDNVDVTDYYNSNSFRVTFKSKWSQENIDFECENGTIFIIKDSNYFSIRYQKGNIDYVVPDKYLDLNKFDVKDNEFGRKEVEALLGKVGFDYPKNTPLIKTLIKMYLKEDKDAIIMDFFSGSATTADAVMQLNAEDNGNRKFIMVQLPELCEPGTDAHKKGYSNICEIGQARIRKAGQKIYKELKEKYDNAGLLADECINPDNLDLGFKVFKLESTNIKPWDGEKKVDENTIFDFADTIKEDRTNIDVVYEIMLKYGIFNMPLKEVQINSKTMYNIGEGFMIICLEDDINMQDVTEIALKKPHCVVFKEKGFEDDNVKINATYTLERLGVEDVKCI